jgi:hypothetical protein
MQAVETARTQGETEAETLEQVTAVTPENNVGEPMNEMV